MRILLTAMLLLLSLFVWGKDNKSQSLKTEMSFEDLLVQGKYHFSDEAITTVEDDKILDALLPVRKDFKKRVERSARRH